MRRSRFYAGILMVLLTAAGITSADTLKVGPGEKFAKPSQAFAAAAEGDVIEIAAGEYRGDVAIIQTNKLLIRGMGRQPVKIPADGKNAGGKARSRRGSIGRRRQRIRSLQSNLVAKSSGCGRLSHNSND